MAFRRASSKGQSQQINVRFDGLTAEFLKRKANEAGISVTEFVRQMVTRGIHAENIATVEARLKEYSAKMGLIDPVMLSILTVEALLMMSVKRTNPTDIPQAWQAARAHLRELRDRANADPDQTELPLK